MHRPVELAAAIPFIGGEFEPLIRCRFNPEASRRGFATIGRELEGEARMTQTFRSSAA
jgi:hypothetical protein